MPDRFRFRNQFNFVPTRPVPPGNLPERRKLRPDDFNVDRQQNQGIFGIESEPAER